MISRCTINTIAVVLVNFTVLASAQVMPSPLPTITPTDDIVVKGFRDLGLNDPKAPVTHQTLGSNRTGSSAIASYSLAAMAERFARCAITTDLASTPRAQEALQRALDGTINGAGQRFWQSRFVQVKSTCAQDAQLARQQGLASFEQGRYDPSYYDRGAMYLRAIQVFAPSLKLTKSQTGDPIIQQRFDTREIPLARYRLPVDRHYFETAVCLVRMEPEVAVRLVQTQRKALITALEASLVNRGLVCLGGAKKVYFDPAQFRMYIADAVYRWAVAVKGVGSLVPSE